MEVFHSGVSSAFNLTLSSRSGSFTDPRNNIVVYDNIPGGTNPNYTSGLDQIEDIPALTDNTLGYTGNVYMNLMPYSSSLGNTNNSFIYLVFFKIASIYTK